MKANELMVGDWVVFNPNVFIEDEYEERKPCWNTQIKSGEDIDLASEGCFEPIPLTSAIMKANSFSHDVIGCDCHGKWQKIIGIDAINVSDCGIEYKSIHNFSFTFRLQGIQLYYVHELQHALRLCGFNELADNFKIE